MAEKQTSQGQTLERAQTEGRDASSKPQWGQPGHEPPTEEQSFEWNGDMAGAPEWIDRGWAGYDNGAALNVPKGDPSKAPYTTQVARVGDTVVYKPGKNGAFGGFAVVKAQDMGMQPGGEPEINSETGTPTFRPAAQTEADLNDLVKTGLVDKDDMDADARAQLATRASGGKPITAEEAGHIPGGNEGKQGKPARGKAQEAKPPRE